MIVSWFSCGAASAVATKLAVEMYDDVVVVNTPIREEHPDNLRFMTDVEEWVGQSIRLATNPKFPTNSAEEVWRKRKYMSGVKGAPCTSELKKEARYLFEKKHDIDYHVFGFTAEEKTRAERFKKTERDNILTPLIERNITKDGCAAILIGAGIELPRLYLEGFPNNNCIGCVKATSPTYWNHVRQWYPGYFADRAALSREIGSKLVRVKGKRIFLDQLKPTDKGQPMKSLNFDCGLFCEEYWEQQNDEG